VRDQTGGDSPSKPKTNNKKRKRASGGRRSGGSSSPSRQRQRNNCPLPFWMNYQSQNNGHSCGRYSLDNVLAVLDLQQFLSDAALEQLCRADGLVSGLNRNTNVHGVYHGNYFTDEALEKAIVERSQNRMSLKQINLPGSHSIYGEPFPQNEPSYQHAHIYLKGTMGHWTMYYNQPEFDTRYLAAGRQETEAPEAGWYMVDSLGGSRRFGDYNAMLNEFLQGDPQHLLRVVSNPDPAFAGATDGFARKIPVNNFVWRAGWIDGGYVAP